MKPNEYVKQAIITESRDFSTPFLDVMFAVNRLISKLTKRSETLAERMSKKRNIRLNHASIGMMTEIGELYEMLEKDILDLTNLREEAGDATWYAALAVDELGLNLEKLMDAGYIALANSGYSSKMSEEEKRKHITKIIGEAAKVVSTMTIDPMKKTAFYGKPLKEEMFASGLEQLMTQMMLLLQIGDFNIEDAFDINIAKLQKKRYKSGSFSSKEAIVRDLTEERKTLEGKD